MKKEITICDRCKDTTENNCENMERAGFNVYHNADKLDLCYKCEQAFLDFMDYTKV